MDRRNNNKKNPFVKYVFVGTLLFLVILLLVLFFVGVVYFISFFRKNINANEERESYRYRHLEINTAQNITTRSVATLYDVIPRGDFRFSTSTSDSYTLISNFQDDDEYQCFGTCLCLPEGEFSKRRNVGTVLSSGLRYLLVAVSASIAIHQATEYFEDECQESFNEAGEESCGIERIVSRVDGCEKVNNVANYKKSGKRILCRGNCVAILTGKDRRDMETDMEQKVMNRFGALQDRDGMEGRIQDLTDEIVGNINEVDEKHWTGMCEASELEMVFNEGSIVDDSVAKELVAWMNFQNHGDHEYVAKVMGDWPTSGNDIKLDRQAMETKSLAFERFYLTPFCLGKNGISVPEAFDESIVLNKYVKGEIEDIRGRFKSFQFNYKELFQGVRVCRAEAFGCPSMTSRSCECSYLD